MTLPKIVLVDGHPAMRLGLKDLLNANGMWVAGESGNGDEALRLVEEMRPDLVVLDLNLAGETNGVELCSRIKSLPGAPYVLVHTAHNFARDVSPCLLASRSRPPRLLRIRRKWYLLSFNMVGTKLTRFQRVGIASY